MLGCDQQHGISKSNQFKGEPPDEPFLQTTHRGKTLNFQGRMKANLLNLGVDYQVLRSKPNQGGGYDEAIKSSSIPDHVSTVKEAPKAYYKDEMKAMLSLGDATDSRDQKHSSSQFYKAAPKLLWMTFRMRRAQRFSLENYVWRPGAVSSPLPQAEDTQRRAKELYSFSFTRFCPIGFSEKGFNEATPLVRIPELVTSLTHLPQAQECLSLHSHARN